MKSGQKTKGIANKLYLLTGAGVLGLLVFGVVAYNTVNTVKVNGPHYQRVVENKDLLADVLPPPAYIVEAYLTVEQLCEAKDHAERAELLKKYAKLKEDFATRQKFWRDTLADGPLKTEITETSRKPAEAFFGVVDNELLPALEKNDSAAVKNIVTTKLPPLYSLHRDSVDKIVEQTTQRAAQAESEVAGTVARITWTQCLIGLGIAATICGLTYWLRRSVVAQEKKGVDDGAKLDAISRAQAVIEFQMDGTIVTANDNFLS